MAAADLLPRFFKVSVSHLSSDSMQIPFSYYGQFPNRLSKTAILQGPGGGSWNVSVLKKQDEVYFAKGWVKFVEDNRLCDGDFLTFVYNGDRIFEVSIYRHDGCKDFVDKEDHISLSSEDKDSETESEMVKPIPRIKNKGKLKEKDCDGDDDDYIDAFGSMEVSENSNNSDSSYTPSIEYPVACVEPKATNSKKKGKSQVIVVGEEDASSDSCFSGELKVVRKRSEKAKLKIINPEAYMENPKNICFETNVKNRPYELLVQAQLVKDYDLKFEESVDYIDKFGKLPAQAVTWGDGRVVIKRWIRICERNKLKKNDAILCELFRKRDVVYAIKLHIVRAKEFIK